MPERFAYSMTKGAVHTMTMSIAVDYVKQNIRCNCICPARIHTPFVDEYVAQHYAGREQETLQQLVGLSTDRTNGHAGGGGAAWRCISARTKRRSSPVRRTRSTAGCSSHEAHSLRRAGPRAARPAARRRRRASTRRRSAQDYDEAFFGNDGLARLREWAARERRPRAARAAGHASRRLRSAVRARSSASA